MSEPKNIPTPATYIASGDGYGFPLGDIKKAHKRRWRVMRKSTSQPSPLATANRSKLSAKSLSKGALLTGATRGTDEFSIVSLKSAKARSIVQRIIHKFGKRARRARPYTAAAEPEPPKIEELGIPPRLLEKWKERKELKKQVAISGAKPVAQRGAGMVIIIGLSSGSVTWLKDLLRQWRQEYGIVLAACIVAAAVGIACALVLRRCT